MSFTQLALGLHWIHCNQIIHRDLKPENIFLHGTTYKIGDFGICRKIDSSRLTITKTCGVGTQYYQAPEQVVGIKYDNSVDIFSLGIVFYLLASRTLPFSNLYELREVEPPYITTVTHEINSIIQKMLSKKPKQRPKIEDLLMHPLLKGCIELIEEK